MISFFILKVKRRLIDIGYPTGSLSYFSIKLPCYFSDSQNQCCSMLRLAKADDIFYAMSDLKSQQICGNISSTFEVNMPFTVTH